MVDARVISPSVLLLFCFFFFTACLLFLSSSFASTSRLNSFHVFRRSRWRKACIYPHNGTLQMTIDFRTSLEFLQKFQNLGLPAKKRCHTKRQI